MKYIVCTNDDCILRFKVCTRISKFVAVNRPWSVFSSAEKYMVIVELTDEDLTYLVLKGIQYFEAPEHYKFKVGDTKPYMQMSLHDYNNLYNRMQKAGF